MAPLLNVKHMTHFFGGLRAVSDFNLTIEPGEIRGLIGPNGAGKTTVFNLITGVYTPTEGIVELEGKNIRGVETHQIASMGLGRTFQNLALWRHMNVLDHIRMAHYSQLSYGLFGAFFGTPNTRVWMNSQSSITNFIRCSIMKIATPKSRCTWRIISIILINSSGVMPAVGSSRNRIFGLVAMARAISTLRWAPYGRLPMIWVANWSISKISMSR